MLQVYLSISAVITLKGHSPRVRNISKIPRLSSDLKSVRSEIEKIYQEMVKTQSDLVAEVPSVSNPYLMIKVVLQVSCIATLTEIKIMIFLMRKQKEDLIKLFVTANSKKIWPSIPA